MNIYQQELLDHYHYSPFRRVLAYSDFVSGEYNPSCGDKVSMQGTVVDGTVQEMVFEGCGCVISQAAASLLCREAAGKPVEQLLTLDTAYMVELINIPLGPTRLKCALLALYALQQGLKQYQSKGM